VLKPGYSAWDRTSVRGLLRGLGTERVVIVGTVTEMCVRDSAHDLEEGLAGPERG
jgi:nicotinamidase-related amidase